MELKSYPKLRGRIVEKFGTLTNFADCLKMNRATLSYRLNSKKGIRQKDIIAICDALDIDKADIGDYFFNFKDVN